MKRILLGLALFAAPFEQASAQSWTFYGCSTFSCHTAVFEVTELKTPSVFENVLWTKQLAVSYTHDFGANGGFFPYLGAYFFEMPTYTGSQLRGLWDELGWNSANTCTSPCFGIVRDGKGGWVRDNWTASVASIALYNPREATYRDFPNGYRYMLDPGPLVSVNLQLVPEPSTYALLGAGLVLLLTIARRRGRMRSV